MIYTNKTTNEFIVNCNCGCSDGMEFKFTSDDEINQYYIDLIASKFYTEQNTGWARFKWTVKKIWKIVRGKDFYYSEIILNEERWNEFKTAVNMIGSKPQ